MSSRRPTCSVRSSACVSEAQAAQIGGGWGGRGGARVQQALRAAAALEYKHGGRTHQAQPRDLLPPCAEPSAQHPQRGALRQPLHGAVHRHLFAALRGHAAYTPAPRKRTSGRGAGRRAHLLTPGMRLQCLLLALQQQKRARLTVRRGCRAAGALPHNLCAPAAVRRRLVHLQRTATRVVARSASGRRAHVY